MNFITLCVIHGEIRQIMCREAPLGHNGTDRKLKMGMEAFFGQEIDWLQVKLSLLGPETTENLLQNYF